MIQAERTPAAAPHLLQLQQRSSLSLTAVQDVTAYDCCSVTLETGCGILTVSGEDIRVKRFSAESGEAEITGKIDCLQYQQPKAHTGFWQRLRRESAPL